MYSIATKAQPQGWQPNWSSALILYRVDNLLKIITSFTSFIFYGRQERLLALLNGNYRYRPSGYRRNRTSAYKLEATTIQAAHIQNPPAFTLPARHPFMPFSLASALTIRNQAQASSITRKGAWLSWVYSGLSHACSAATKAAAEGTLLTPSAVSSASISSSLSSSSRTRSRA